MNILSSVQSLQKKAQEQLQLTEAQRRMYALEKQENFRWISKVVATYSSYTLSDEDLVGEGVAEWLQEIGQFAEVVYSVVPLGSLLRDYEKMKHRGFPLEGYYSLSPTNQSPSFSFPTSLPSTASRSRPPTTSSGLRLVRSFKGNVAQLPAAVFSRWIHTHECSMGLSARDPAKGECSTTKSIHRRQQIIVSICGTASIQQVLKDLKAIRKVHPGVAHGTAGVHSGFWDLYQGLKPELLEVIRKTSQSNPPREDKESEGPTADDPGVLADETDQTESSECRAPRELVVTGHSMGGAVAHLLCLDLISATSRPSGPQRSTSSVHTSNSSGSNTSGPNLSGSNHSSPHTTTRSPSAETGSSHEDSGRPKGTSYFHEFGFNSLHIVTFGEPRAGNQALVDYWSAEKTRHENEYGTEIREWCVKGYNDGVPALPPVKLGYRHFAREPLYTVNGKLYRVPATENEHALFRVDPTIRSRQVGADASHRPIPPSYPLGGHNYYNERDLEGGFLRRIEWLVSAGYEKEGWEERYLGIMKKHLG